MSSEMYLPKRVADQPQADTAIMAEIDSYTHICAKFDASQYADPEHDGRYDILRFWDDHKKILPIHYNVFLGDCGSKRAASASVETVYSGKYCPSLPPDPCSSMPTHPNPVCSRLAGATKMSDKAFQLGDNELAAYVFNHYNWKFDFLRLTVTEIVNEYLKVHVRGGNTGPDDQHQCP